MSQTNHICHVANYTLNELICVHQMFPVMRGMQIVQGDYFVNSCIIVAIVVVFKGPKYQISWVIKARSLCCDLYRGHAFFAQKFLENVLGNHEPSVINNSFTFILNHLN